jgi:hypothetical protein
MRGTTAKRRPLSREELAVWHWAVQGVRPLAHVKPPPPPPPPAVAEPPPVVEVPPAVVTRRHGPPPRRRGDFSVEAALDLHGMTQKAAHAALLRFVRASVEQGRRHLLVITGKGGATEPGVLRREVPRWLEAMHPPPLAIVAAPPQHGGDGALYVLLKRRR